MRLWLASLLQGYRRISTQPVRAASSASGCGPNCAYADHEHNTPGQELARHYKILPSRLPEAYGPVIQPLELDAETQNFIDSCEPNWLVDFAAKVLRLFFSLTDTNGMLKRGSMFVLSTAQAQDLLGLGLAEAKMSKREPLSLFDVGAGDGEVTARLVAAGGFSRVVCTEVSRPMVSRLASRGWTARHTSHINRDAMPESGAFDVVALMNLLDRCDHPKEMLMDASRLAVPGTGRIMIALVLPFSEFVEDGTKRRAPYGPLPMGGSRCADGVTFEASLSTFLTRVVKPCGLLVERIARVPYLCRGDSKKRYYVLSDVILVLRHASEAEKAAGIVTVAGTALR